MNTKTPVSKNVTADLYVGGKRVTVIDENFWMDNLDKYIQDPSVVHTLNMILENWLKDEAFPKISVDARTPKHAVLKKKFNEFNPRLMTEEKDFNPQYDLWKLHPKCYLKSEPNGVHSMRRFELMGGDKYIVYLAYQVLKLAYPDAILQIMSAKFTYKKLPQYIVAATLKDEVIILDLTTEADKTSHELLRGFVRNDELMKGLCHYIS